MVCFKPDDASNLMPAIDNPDFPDEIGEIPSVLQPFFGGLMLLMTTNLDPTVVFAIAAVYEKMQTLSHAIHFFTNGDEGIEFADSQTTVPDKTQMIICWVINHILNKVCHRDHVNQKLIAPNRNGENHATPDKVCINLDMVHNETELIRSVYDLVFVPDEFIHTWASANISIRNLREVVLASYGDDFKELFDHIIVRLQIDLSMISQRIIMDDDYVHDYEAFDYNPTVKPDDFNRFLSAVNRFVLPVNDVIIPLFI